MIIVPKDWREFQHYKDRAPPWIRLHKKLLDNYEFHCLPVASKALAPLLWLLASDHLEGEIDADPGKLGFRFRMSDADVMGALNPLIQAGFFVVLRDASKALADCKQVDVPETEALQSTEAEAEADSATASRPAKSPAAPPTNVTVSDLISEGVDPQHARDWLEVRKKHKAPLTKTAWDSTKDEAIKAGITAGQAVQICAKASWRGFVASYNWRQHLQQAAAQGAGKASVSPVTGETPEQTAARRAEARRLAFGSKPQGDVIDA